MASCLFVFNKYGYGWEDTQKDRNLEKDEFIPLGL